MVLNNPLILIVACHAKPEGRSVVEAAGVELGTPHFPQIVICRAFLLILKQLNPFLQSSINKISSIIPFKIKIFYTKFTPNLPQGKNQKQLKIIFQDLRQI